LNEPQPDQAVSKISSSGSFEAKSLLRSASWMSGAQGAAQLSAYASLLILAHLIPPEAFGAVATGTAILYIGVVLMDSGARGSIIVAPVITTRFLHTVLARSLGLGVILCAVVVLSSGALSRAFTGGGHPGTIAALALGIPLYSLAVVPMGLLQRAMHFRVFAMATAAANVGSALVAVVAGILGAGIWALVSRQLVWCGLLAILMARGAARHVSPRESGSAAKANPVARWFLLFAVTQVLTFNLDYLVIGRQSAATQLGLYSVAFMIAFAPLQHFSSAVGQVLMSAAAATGVSASGARTVVATRLMALVLLPVIPVVVVLAPTLLPVMLGKRWTGMVVPFELLVAAGIGYSIVNCIGEALSGIGEMPFRAKFNVGWCLITLAALVVLVHFDGIRGAALAHLLVFLGYGSVFVTSGMHRLGMPSRVLWRALYPVIIAVGGQAIVTFAVEAALRSADVGRGPSAFAGAAFGVVSLVIIGTRGQGAPLRQAVSLVRAARVDA
jgi:teichuronic acid exporter